jgi:hypothetical protein
LLPSRFVRVLAPESRTESSPDFRIGKSPKFGPSTVEIPGFHVFMTPPLHRIKVPEFETSQVPDFLDSRIPCSWKTYFENSVKLDVSRVTCFPEFPNIDAGKKIALLPPGCNVAGEESRGNELVVCLME